MKLFRETWLFFKGIVEGRALLFQLIKRDLVTQYTDSYLGVVWIYLQPIIFIGVLWFIFSTGLRGGGDVDGAPYFSYLSTGMICWFYFSNNFNGNTFVVKQHSFLVRRVNMRLGLLPIVKIVSMLFPHLTLLVFVTVISVIKGVAPSIYYVQTLYYLFAMMALLLGLGWLTASMNVFVSDVGKLVGVLVQLGFWMTPIFWKASMMPEKYLRILMINPMFYIVTGYRDSLIYQVPFWDKPYQTLYFWFLTVTLLLTGAIVFKRLRPHFAEVV